jgi:hypothetical protein
VGDGEGEGGRKVIEMRLPATIEALIRLRGVKREMMLPIIWKRVGKHFETRVHWIAELHGILGRLLEVGIWDNGSLIPGEPREVTTERDMPPMEPGDELDLVWNLELKWSAR